MNPRPPTAAARAAQDATDWTALQTLLLRLGGVGLFALLPWAGAHVAIPVGKYGVPVTLQTLAVILAAVCIGPRLGSLSMLLYVTMGLVGMPVFAEGESGPATILGQTGGYILGFVLCQPVIVACIRRHDGSIRGWGAMVAGMLAGHAVIFAIGVPWLWAARRFWLDDPAITAWDAFYHGCVLFLPGMALKTGIAVLIGRIAAPWGSRRFW